MRKILAILLLISTIILVGCSSSGSTSTSETKTLSPVLIKEWKGSATKTTESFTISANEWAIAWAFQPSPPTYGIYANLFSIDVYEAGDSLPVSLIANFANVSTKQSDISYMHQPGKFYLNITSLEGSWAIEVYDYR